MNTKLIPLICFAVWSALCWNWYVCEIKEACAQKDVGGPVVTTPAIEPETPPANGQSSKPTVTKPSEETDIGSVRLEEVEDRVVINFPYSSTRREDNDAIDDYLSRLADYLKSSGKTVTITGHTDFVGDSKTNYSYGMSRANGIRDVLVKKGVSKAQIKCKSFGESKPVASNDTALGRYKNRRAEIRIND